MTTDEAFAYGFMWGLTRLVPALFLAKIIFDIATLQ